MTQEQIELARHALGLPNKRSRSYRNHYVAGAGHVDFENWLAMVEAGKAKRQENAPHCGGDDVFWLTPSGAREALRPRETLDPEDFPQS